MAIGKGRVPDVALVSADGVLRPCLVVRAGGHEVDELMC